MQYNELNMDRQYFYSDFKKNFTISFVICNIPIAPTFFREDFYLTLFSFFLLSYNDVSFWGKNEHNIRCFDPQVCAQAKRTHACNGQTGVFTY